MPESYDCKICNGTGKIHSSILNKILNEVYKISLDNNSGKEYLKPLSYSYEDGWHNCYCCGGSGKFDWLDKLVGKDKQSEGNPIVVSLIRKFYPSTISKDLVDVQPIKIEKEDDSDE